MKYELTKHLFGGFADNFEVLFLDPDLGYKADKGFFADFMANLYCRNFIKGQEIVRMGEVCDELFLISQGQIDVQWMPKGDKRRKNLLIQIAKLPQYSYFCEWEIVLNLRSSFIYKADQESSPTTTMCLNTKIFTALLNRYPNVHDHWLAQAKIRRREFRRLRFMAEECFELQMRTPEFTEEKEKKMFKINLDNLFDHPHLFDVFKSKKDEELDAIELQNDATDQKKKSRTKQIKTDLNTIEGQIGSFSTAMDRLEAKFDKNINTLNDQVDAQDKKARIDLTELSKQTKELVDCASAEIRKSLQRLLPSKKE